jgi:glycosyltransferase involved in cell wall biosynthesis
MFAELPEPPSAPRTSIFTQPLVERIDALMRRPRRVAWLYRAPDTSTFRYRVANVISTVQALPGEPFGATWFSEPELDVVSHLVRHLDALVVTRFPMSAPLRRILDVAQHHDVPLIFDCDDLVFEPELAAVIMDAVGVNTELDPNWERWFAYTSRIRATMDLCSSGITTGRTLRKHMHPRFPSGHVAVVPNYLDPVQQLVSRELLGAKQASGWARDRSVVLGYFSGTPTHARDFAVAAPAIGHVLRRHPETRLRIVGQLELGEAFEGLEDRVERLAFMDFLALQHSIAEVEVNLAPLQHHPFTACKSELKYFEAAAVGTWTVASATPSFGDAIDDGVTGRLARAHEWDAALEEAISLAQDRVAYAERAIRAAESVHERYGTHTHGPAIVTALEAGIAVGATPSDHGSGDTVGPPRRPRTEEGMRA